MLTLQEREIWIKYIKTNRYSKKDTYLYTKEPLFPEIPEHIAKDPIIACSLVLDGGEKLFNIHPDLLNSKKFILKFLEYQNAAGHFCHFPKEFQNDKEIIEISYKYNPTLFKYVTYKKTDIEFIHHLLSINGDGLESMPKEIKENKESCLIALSNKSSAIAFVSKKLIVDLCKDSQLVYNILHNYPEGFKFLSRKIRNNPKYAFLAIKNLPDNFEHSLNAINDNKDIVLELVELFQCKTYYASEKVQHDREVQLANLKNKNTNFSYVPKVFTKDLSFIVDAIKINWEVYNQLSLDMKSNTLVIEAFLNNTEANNFYLLPSTILAEIGQNNPLQYISQKKLREQLAGELPTKEIIKKMKI